MRSARVAYHLGGDGERDTDARREIQRIEVGTAKRDALLDRQLVCQNRRRR